MTDDTTTNSKMNASRRALLKAGAVGVAGTYAVAAAGAGNANHDPRRSAQGQVKINATLDGSPALWAYTGMIYAIKPRLRPMPLLRLAGCQVFWADRQPDGAYRLSARLLTFFRATDSGAFLDEFDNPYTGKRNAVRANMFGGSAAIYPADGSAMRVDGPIKASESTPQGIAAQPAVPIGRVEWSLTRDSVVLDTDHAFNVAIQPQVEAQTFTADRRSFFDSGITRMGARYSATTVSPWLAWLDMADADGHLVWHTAGEKVFSVQELPADYRARAAAQLDELLSKPGG